MEIKNCYDFGVTVAEPCPSSFDLGSSFGAVFSSVGFSFFLGFTLAEPLPFPLVRVFTNISSPPTSRAHCFLPVLLVNTS